MTDENQSTGRKERPTRRRAAVAAFVFIVVGAGLAYLGSDDFRDRVLTTILVEIDRQIPGSVHAERFEGSFRRGVTVRGLEVRREASTVLRIEAITVKIGWSAFLFGRLGVDRIAIDRPTSTMREAADGSWDLVDTLSPASDARNEEAPRPALFPVWIDRVEIRSGAIRIVPADGNAIAIDGLDADAAGNRHGRSLEITLRRMRADLEQDHWPPFALDIAGDYTRRGTKHEITIERFELASADSRLQARGEIVPGESLDVGIEIGALSGEDLARIVPRFAGLPDATGKLRGVGPWNRIRFEGGLDWVDASLAFEGTTDVERIDSVPAGFSLRFDAPRLDRWLTDREWGGHLSVLLDIVRDDARFDASWRHPGGSLDLHGRIEALLDEDTLPTFEYDARSRGLDLAQLFLGRPEWSSHLTATASGTGRGRDFEELESTAEFAFAPSRLGSLEIDRSEGLIQLEDARLVLSDVEVAAGIGIARLAGHVSIRPDGPLALEGRVDLADLGPLLALVEQDASGAIEGDFRIDGRLDDARLVADLRVDSFEMNDVRAQRTTIDLDVGGLPSLPVTGSARFDVSGLASPAFDGDLEVIAQGSGGQRQRFEITLDATDVDAARHHLQVEGRLENEAIAATLRDARFDWNGASWQLERAFGFAVERDAFETEVFTFRAGQASLEGKGRISRSGTQDFEMKSRSFPLDIVADRLRRAGNDDLDIGGSLDLDLEVTGTASAPVLSLDLRTEDLRVEDQPFEAFGGEIDYRSKAFHVDLEMVQSEDRRVVLQGAVPTELSWSEAFDLGPGSEMDLHLVGGPFDIAFLGPFVAEDVENLRGRAEFDVRLLGTLDRPQPKGSLRVWDLHFRPRATQVPVEDLSLAMTLDASRAQIESLTATAGDGHLSGSGTLFYDSGSFETLVASLDLERWPLISTQSYRLVSSGSLEAQSRSDVLSLSGEVDIVEGTLRPDLDFLTASAPDRDPSITFEEDRPIAAQGEVPDDPGAAEEILPLHRLALDVRFRVARNLWIKHEQANVELRGDVTARKAAGEDLVLDGQIETQRGWVTLQGRRFKLVEGKIEFTGGKEIDPSLAILGRYKVPDYTIDARMGGTATAPTLELSSTPRLDEADILAVLLFGRPLSLLAEAEKTTLANRASTLAASFGITAAGKSLSRALRLEDAGIQIEELSQDRAAVGAYLGEKTFVTVAQGFGEEAGQQLSIEYEFWPGWSIVTTTTSGGTNSADLFWKIRY